MKKRLNALILALLIIGSSCTALFFAYANENKQVNANILMFDNIIENKPWIIESLAYGNFSNNPFTLSIPYASETSIMTEVLDNYKNDKAFKYLVDGMEVYKNTGNYVQSAIEELWEIFNSQTGILTDDELLSFVDKSIKSAGELKYDSILNDVFLTNYTSSWNSSLFESNAKIETYRQRSKILSSLSKYQKALKSNSDYLSTGYFKTEKDFKKYVDNFIDAYETNLHTVLTTVPFLSNYKKTLKNNETVSKYITGALVTAGIIKSELEAPSNIQENISKEAKSTMSDIYCDCFASGTNFILKSADKTINIANAATKYAMLLEGLLSQNDTTVDVLNRIYNNTSDGDLQTVIDYYSDLVEDEKERQTLNCDLLIDYISKKGLIGKYSSKFAWKTFDEFLTIEKGYYDVDLKIMTNATSQNLIKFGKCASMGIWLADKATSIESTSKEIYVCKYTNKLLDETIKIYKADYKNYVNNKTDDNAKKCIDDLEFIKKLRLYGEKHAYDSMSSQTDSVIGILLGGSDATAYLEKRYQAQVDALIGCAILPQSTFEFTVGKDEELIFMPNVLENGEVTLEAVYKKSDKTTIVIPEADTTLMSTITVTDGTVKLLSTDSNDLPMFITALNFNGKCNLDIYGSALAVGYLENSGTLNVNLAKESSKLIVPSVGSNTGTLNFTGSGKEAEIYSFTNSGTVNTNYSYLNITGDLANSGTVKGKVLITANGKSDYIVDSYSTLPTPSISGNGSIENLEFNSDYKKSINISGTQIITKSLSTGNTKVSSSENLIVTGDCVISGNTIKGNITFRDYATNSPLTISGIAYIENDVVMNHKVDLNSGLYLTSSCNTLTVNGTLQIKGDMKYVAGTIKGTDGLKLYNDLDVTASSPGIAKLEFVGNTPQSVTCSSDLTVNQLSNANTSSGGVTFNSKLYVTDTLTSSETAKYKGGKNIILTGDAKLVGNKINGSISAENWSITDFLTVTETFYTSGQITVGEKLTLNVCNYEQSGGTLTLGKSDSFTCKSFNNTGQMSLDEDSVFNCNGEFLLNGNCDSKGSMTIKGDCIFNGKINGNSLTVCGDVTCADMIVTALNFKSKISQYISSSGTVQITQLTVDNVPSNINNKVGVSFNSPIIVTQSFVCKPPSAYSNGKNLIMTDTATFSETKIRGDISAKNWTITDSLTITGTLFTSESIKLNENVELDVIHYEQSNGSLGMAKSSSIICEFFNENGSFTAEDDTSIDCDGDFSLAGTGSGNAAIKVSGDCVLKDSFDGKSMILNSDLLCSTTNISQLTFESKAPQLAKTSGTITVDDLTVNNTSSSGLTVDGSIIVNKNLDVSKSNITNSSNIKLSAENVLIGDQFGDIYSDGKLTLDKDTVINGTVRLSSGAELTVEENVTVTVKRFVDAKSGKITVKKGGKLIIGEYMYLSSVNLTVDGELSVNTDMLLNSVNLNSPGKITVKGDARISSSTVNATGMITLMGDLDTSSGTWNRPNISFIGKTPQVISGSAINVGNLTIKNQSKTGIKISSTLNYSGDLDKSSSIISGEENLKVKS